MAVILLVDDEHSVLRGLRRMLRTHAPHWRAMSAHSAAEARQKLGDQLPDVIVTDLRMAGVDGLEFIADVRNDRQLAMIPIIVLSGHRTEEDERVAWELGIHDFVAKPVQPLQFIARIRAAVRTKRFTEFLQKQNDVMQRELMRLQKSDALGKLAAEATHDLSNMLAITIGRTEMAQHVVADSREAQKSLTQALHSAEHARRMVEHMRTLGQTSAAGPAAEITPAVDEAMELISLIIPPGIKVVVHSTPLSQNLQIDETRLYQLLLNLCTNAIHAMGTEGTLTVSLRESQFGLERNEGGSPVRRAPGALLQVRDTGHGIPAETLDRIWELFFTTKSVTQGSGVGLAVVKRIVDEMGATIAVQSQVGMGTCFSVFIPYTTDAGQSSAVETERAGNAEEANSLRR